MREAFASELQAKDATIRALDEDCKEKDETINALRSDMVKMSSTYKQDSYLKRKEIAKLKQQNAEYALKLRALKKAFQCVNATGNMTTVGTEYGSTKFMSHSAHGAGAGNGLDGASRSLNCKSLHSESHSRNDGKAAAVSARLGGLSLWSDSKVVQKAIFFDDDARSDRESSLGHEGEDPEEQ
jgi:hypothetical protein